MRKTIERSIIGVVIATGISSVVTQLYTIREFLALFAGNEFVIALIFFNWLILGGAGTMLAHLADRHSVRSASKNPPEHSPDKLAWLSFAAAALPPIQLLTIRLLRDTCFIPGSAVGFYGIFLYTFVTIAPYCLLIGFVLPYSLFVIRRQTPSYPGALIYITDNAGDITGGILFSFVLVLLVTPMQAVLISGVILLLTAVNLVTMRRRPGPGEITALVLILILLAAGAILEKKTLSPSSGSLADYHESRYGRLLVHRDNQQHTLLMDGVPIASSNNRRAAEEAAHYPLAQIDRPAGVLLISAVSGIMREIGKHNPESVDYLEIDPAVSRAMFDFDLLERIPGLRVINSDARRFLSGPGPAYDAIIACLPEPETFQLNRFYTREFFSQIRTRLSRDGVFAFSLEGVADYVSEADRHKISSVYNTAAACFEQVTILPGDKLFFLCADRPISTNIPEILRTRQISTVYIDNYYTGNITAGRIDRVKELLQEDAPINTDIRPSLMRLMFSHWFTRFSATPAPLYIAAILFLLGYFYFITGSEFVLFSTGLINMATEILTIFAFQIFFGYVYFQIGLIVTVFLAGLLPGAWLGEKLRWHGRRTIMVLDGLLMAWLGGFILAVTFGGDSLTIVFYLVYGFVISCVCGFQFPAILRLGGDINRKATAAFSADLIGAAFGALLASVLLIPRAGLTGTAAILIALKTISLGIIWKRR
ncbi:MAG: hypothetical protein ACLFS7_09400 [Desulfosudaceae bacterium]